MEQDFLHASLGKLANPVCRLGFCATYRPGRAAVHKALDEGLNYFFFFGFDDQMTRVVRETIRPRRENYVLATGGYNYIWTHQNLRRTLELRLRQTRAEYIDLFHFLGVMKPGQFTAKVRKELHAVRESGLVRGVSISTHDPSLAVELARDGLLDGMMIRYNAAHRGAEEDVFPLLPASNPAVVAFTATRWTYLLRRPRYYPAASPVPTAGMCYRFVLSHPAVHVCLTAPANVAQLSRNLTELRRGPLAADEMRFMRSFGDIVAKQHRYFM